MENDVWKYVIGIVIGGPVGYLYKWLEFKRQSRKELRNSRRNALRDLHQGIIKYKASCRDTLDSAIEIRKSQRDASESFEATRRTFIELRRGLDSLRTIQWIDAEDLVSDFTAIVNKTYEFEIAATTSSEPLGKFCNSVHISCDHYLNKLAGLIKELEA
jgi:hypothetical protein